MGNYKVTVCYSGGEVIREKPYRALLSATGGFATEVAIAIRSRTRHRVLLQKMQDEKTGIVLAEKQFHEEAATLTQAYFLEV